MGSETVDEIQSKILILIDPELDLGPVNEYNHITWVRKRSPLELIFVNITNI